MQGCTGDMPRQFQKCVKGRAGRAEALATVRHIEVASGFPAVMQVPHESPAVVMDTWIRTGSHKHACLGSSMALPAMH